MISSHSKQESTGVLRGARHTFQAVLFPGVLGVKKDIYIFFNILKSFETSRKMIIYFLLKMHFDNVFM